MLTELPHHASTGAPAEVPAGARDRWAGWAAVAAWAVATPVAMALPSLLDLNPVAPRGAVLPVALGGLLLAGLVALAAWRRLRPYSGVVAGASAGLFAAWIAFMLRAALHGTPFAFAGLLGDQGRMSAMATHFSVGLASSDGIVSGVASEYPPLFPWLVGRTAAVVDVPAWRLLAPAQILTISAAVLIGFLLWRRMVTAPVALALAAVSLLAFGDPRKAHEVLPLLVLLPWAPATFGFPPRGRLHWLPAGLIGGLLATTYLGFLIWGAAGLLGYAAVTIRTVPDRRRYLVHLALVTVVAVATASWYLVPYGWALATHGGQMVSDLFNAPAITGNPFPFLVATPLGALQLIGLLGAVWYRRVAWWATPLLCLVAGAYLYRAIAMLRYVATGHTGLFYHTSRLIGAALAVAGVLTLTRALPRIMARLATRADVPRGIGVVAMALLLAWTGFTYWQVWTPLPVNRYSLLAHAEPLPDGRSPKYAPAAPVVQWFPIDPIRTSVAAVLGPRAAPRTLSYSERLFAYLPWPGYIAVDRTAAASTSNWDDRYAAVRRLAAIRDPAAFAQASAHTAFGRIDLFVLQRAGADWTWRDIHFRPEQFDRSAFTVVPDLPDNTVLAIRR
jgi:Arabinofuranosyltransferase N terminal